MPTHWLRCKAEALVASLRNKLEQNRSRQLVTLWPRRQAEALVVTLPNRLAEIEMQTIGDTLAKVPVGKNANKGGVLDTLQQIG